MYAVIKTGGKQYRVQAGDVLVVEKLGGEPGDNVAFEEVLLLGEGADVVVGAPTISGAKVSATLIETRKGEKVKIFKKTRRQGYRRTRGHRQTETVLRVISVAGGGKTDKWDGEVDLTPLSVLNARARNLARGMEAVAAKKAEAASPVKAKAAPKPKAEAKPKAEPKAKPAAAAATAQVEAEAAPKAAKPKAAAKPKTTAPKGPAQAKAGNAPKPTKGGASAAAPRKTSPRGNKG